MVADKRKLQVIFRSLHVRDQEQFYTGHRSGQCKCIWEHAPYILLNVDGCLPTHTVHLPSHSYAHTYMHTHAHTHMDLYVEEFIAYGAMNLVGAFFSSFTAAGSLSRSTILANFVGKTQVYLFGKHWLFRCYKQYSLTHVRAICIVIL